MSTIDPKLIKELEDQLKAEEARLKSELAKFTQKKSAGKGFEPKFPDFGNDADENAGEVDSFTRSLAIEDTMEKELQDICSSLKRIANGKYGICKFCKKPIEEARLKFRPTSSSCVTCKQKLQDNPDKSIKDLFGDDQK